MYEWRKRLLPADFVAALIPSIYESEGLKSRILNARRIEVSSITVHHWNPSGLHG
jgi:hypothetical protein